MMTSRWLSVETSMMIPHVHSLEWNQWTLCHALENRDDAHALWSDLVQQTDELLQSYFPSLRRRFSSYGGSQVWKRVYICMNMQWSHPLSYWSTSDDEESEADDESSTSQYLADNDEEDEDDDEEEQEQGLLNVHTTTSWMSYRSWIRHALKWQHYWNSASLQLQCIEIGMVLLRPPSR
jgi:hypothetical protein